MRFRSSVAVPRTFVSTAGHWSTGHDAYGVAPSARTSAASPSESPAVSRRSSSSSIVTSSKTSFQKDAPAAFAIGSSASSLAFSASSLELSPRALRASPARSNSTRSIAAASMLPECDARTSAIVAGSRLSNVRSKDFCSVWYAHRLAAARRGIPETRTMASVYRDSDDAHRVVRPSPASLRAVGASA